MATGGIIFRLTVQKCILSFLPSYILVARQSKYEVASEVGLEIPLGARRHATVGKRHPLTVPRFLPIM